MYRWADASQTAIRAPSGAIIPADPANADFAALALGEIAPYQRWASLAEAKAALTDDIEARAAQLRWAVAGTSDAGKLSVYQRKYETAARALANDAGAIAALSAEAAARGETPAQLAALVVQLGDAWTAAGLAIDAAYQTHKAAIAALASAEAAAAYDAGAGWPAL